jgi:tetratricopeptide (TPR) repeat protein
MNYILFSFLVLFSLQSLVSQDLPTYSKKVLCKNQDEIVPAEYYLSIALSFQARLLRSSETERNEIHKRAIEYFNLYITCMKEKGYEVNGNTYFQKAISQFELGDNEAETSLNQALEVDSRHRDAILLKTRLLIQKRQYKEARELLENSITYFSNDSDLLYLLASLNWELGNESKALLYFGSLWNNIQKREGDVRYRTNVLKGIAEILSKRIETDRSARSRAEFYLKMYLKYKPSDLEAKFALALILFYSGKINEARETLLEILHSNSSHQNAIDFLGEIYFLTNRLEALQFLKFQWETNHLKPESYSYYLYILLQGRYKTAKEFFEKSSSRYKNRISNYIALIEIYKKTQEREKLIPIYLQAAKLSYTFKDNLRAIKLMKELIELGQKFSELKEPIAVDYEFIASCYEDMGANYLALNYIRKAISHANSKAEKLRFQIHEANLLRSQSLKRYGESNKILKSLLEQDPNLDGVYFDLGLNHFSMGKYRESLEYYSRAIELSNKQSYYYYYRAISYEKLGYIQETEIDLRKSIELDPNFAPAYNFLGYMFAEKNIELEESLRLIRKAIDLEPDNPAYQDSLGWILFRFGKHEEALHHLQLAEELMEEKKEKDAVVYDHLGDVYFKLNDLPNARASWQKALEIDSQEVDKVKIKEKILNLENIK